MNQVNQHKLANVHSIHRRDFLAQLALLSTSILLLRANTFTSQSESSHALIDIKTPLKNEDLFAYIQRETGGFDIKLYKKLIGTANEFKEGDAILGIAASDEAARQSAKTLIANTKLSSVIEQPLFKDALYDLIKNTTFFDVQVIQMTFLELKNFLLESDEENIKRIMPSLTSDVVALVVKLMSNDELISVSAKVFNKLPNSNIGEKGYLSARVQPNSPTDNVEDIIWQVFDAWSYGVGDLVLGTNPVSSDPVMVARIEAALHDVLVTFGLEKTMPNCVLSHIDIQASVENVQPDTTGIWFQSIASTVAANQTFDVTIEKMQNYADAIQNKLYGLYAETGQGADATNGHSEGFDMVVHEARKYGFLRALKQRIYSNKVSNNDPWVFLNDVAGFIGPEVFRTKEQLVRCCLEDLVMGKLHGLTIGLDICTTLHMDVTIDDLDWCIDQIMPANPAYLMALPTKNDPMLSYLTTSFADHVRIREQFGYKVNNKMWEFFKRIGIIGNDNKPTTLFGQPNQVYLRYCKAKGDLRNDTEILSEGKAAIERIRKRGVPIAEGYGEKPWMLQPALEYEIKELYKDAKYCLWTEWDPSYLHAIQNALIVTTMSVNRIDYVYHPTSGERLSPVALDKIENLSKKLKNNTPDVQIIISDGLNTKSLMDEGHLDKFLPALYKHLTMQNLTLTETPIVIRNGRVRAGYQVGEHLFGKDTERKHCILHIIGERPGTIHRNFSVYITVATASIWNYHGKVDHDITRVISGISDTAYLPEEAVIEVGSIVMELMNKK
jgi:ethanolamine ammonia-lyase large subunit